MKQQFFFRMLRTPGADGGGGGGIVDLFNEAPKDITDPNLEKPGDKPDDKSDDTDDDEEIKVADDDPLKGEALEADGKLKEGYELNAEGKLQKIEAAKSGDTKDDKPADTAADETDVFSEVAKLLGVEALMPAAELVPEGVDLNTPEGQDWLYSPEGISAVIKTQRAAAATDFENYIKETDPRAYSYMLHRQSGGNDEDFFGDGPSVSLPSIEELKTDPELQKQILKHDLLLKGNTEEDADALIQVAITGNKLLEKSEAAWKAIDKAEKDQLAQTELQSKAQNDQFKQLQTQFIGNVSRIIQKEMGFVVPDNEQGAFQQFVTENVRYEGGKFFVVQEVGDEKDLKNKLDSLFLQHRKGDLSKIVARKAASKASQDLRNRSLKTRSTSGGGSSSSANKSGYVPLSEIFNT